MRQVILAATLALMLGVVNADEDLERRIDSLQKELDALRNQVKQSNGGAAEAEPVETVSDDTVSNERDSNEIDIEALETLEADEPLSNREIMARARPANADYLGPAQRLQKHDAWWLRRDQLQQLQR